jgi:hypothetical protein
MINVDSPLQHHFFNISVAEGIRKVPTHRHEYNVLFKLPPFEADHIPSDPGVNFRLVYQFALLLAKEPLLNQHLFDSIEEVQELANQWLWTYNNERPNMAIRGIPPKHMVELVN